MSVNFVSFAAENKTVNHTHVYMSHSAILTITGSDSTGESGVQADITTMTALGAKAVSVITSVTMQNTLGIQHFHDLPASIVSGQLDAIVDDVRPVTVKIGMMRSTEVVSAVVDALKRFRPASVVYAPVLFSSRGDRLMGTETIEAIRQRLFPLCTVIIVRRRESDLLLRGSVAGNVCFLDDATDHGSVNKFASALAVHLNDGDTVADATGKAHDYARRQLSAGTMLTGRSGELYAEFVALVKKSPSTKADIAHYADALNVSSRYLGQVCRQVAGQSPKSIVDSYLVEEVKSHLTATRDTVQQTALAFGFANQAHLSKFFKKLTGLTPTEYRVRHRA